MEPISEVFNELHLTRKVAITMHQKPDGDAMGSALGLFHFLIQFGHDVHVISPTNWASFLNWMPNCDKVVDFERFPNKAKEVINEAEWLFCLDFNTLYRTKNLAPLLMEFAGKRILIDHHELPDVESFAYGVSDPSKSSTCEMVFDFIVDSGNEDKINKEVATCLYAGTVTDTGSFRFPSTTAEVHSMVAKLKSKGIDHHIIHESIYDNFSESRLRFIGNTLLNRMEIFYEYNTALISIPQADLIKYEIKTGDTEGLVNYPLSISGIKLAAIIIDRGDERKSSFRSKGEFDVNIFARKYFNGGGHANAAGGNNKESLEEVIKMFKAAIQENKNLLSTYQF